MDFTLILLLILILIGAVNLYLIWLKSSSTSDLKQKSHQELELKNKNSELQIERLQGKLETTSDAVKKHDIELSKLRLEKEELIAELNVSITKNNENIKRLEINKEEIELVRLNLQKEFQLVANKIIKENTEQLSKSNSEKIGDLLNPLKEKISDFEKQVQDKYTLQLKDTESLKTEIKGLYNLNQQLSKDAENLTKALKGDSKKQGNWGEFILERVLEMSGLRKGEEYFTQHHDENIDGQTILPDIVIQLPENKHLIVDSKVSLLDYERFISAEDEDERQLHLKAHINSLKTHIKGLSNKNYHTSKSLNTPDFVILFIPIESSFSLSITHDPSLFNYAWEKKIVIVSPSTLLASLRTISNIWKIERRNKNAEKIAIESGRLYDKFVGFIEDMQKIGGRIDQTKKSYDDAMNKLQYGSGNLIRKAEHLRELGAKNTKLLATDLTQESDSKSIQN